MLGIFIRHPQQTQMRAAEQQIGFLLLLPGQCRRQPANEETGLFLCFQFHRDRQQFCQGDDGALEEGRNPGANDVASCRRVAAMAFRVETGKEIPLFEKKETLVILPQPGLAGGYKAAGDRNACGNSSSACT